MKEYTIYCTKEQTKKALELGAPIEMDSHSYGQPYIQKRTSFILCPTAEQMTQWLEEKNVNVTISNVGSYISSVWYPTHQGIKYLNITNNSFSTRKEATLAAIDAALDYLINNK